jgi:hypothetical protein
MSLLSKQWEIKLYIILIRHRILHKPVYNFNKTYIFFIDLYIILIRHGILQKLVYYFNKT